MSGVLNLLLATAGRRVRLSNLSKTDVENDPTNALAQIKVDADGIVYSDTGAGYASEYTWLELGLNSAYEVKLTVTSGSFNLGTTGTWLACSTDRAWGNLTSVPAALAGTGTLEIRDAVTLAVLASCTITCNATEI